MRADVLTLLQQKGCGASKVVGDRFRASKKRGGITFQSSLLLGVMVAKHLLG